MEDRFENWMPPEIEEGRLTRWNWMVQHKENLKLGRKTDIGAFCYINAKNKVIIEDGVQIASHCSIYSTSTIDNKDKQVLLKKNCKIGSHTTITPGVTIGENSVIGAHSFVNSNIPDNVVAYGIPARVIRKLDSPPTSQESSICPLFKMHSDSQDIRSITQILQRGSFWADGPEIKEFENKIAEYTGRKYAIAFNSGTSALHALMIAYEINQGEEVIVPSFTFISTANAPLFVGAEPKFAEIEPKTLALDINDVKKKITGRTKAIIAVHYAGHPCINIKELKKLAEEFNLILIEDAAESLGAKIENKKVGSFGDSAMFSFCQNKILTTGEGGMIVTDSEKLARKLRLIVSHGRVSGDYFAGAETDYIQLGYNWRMPTILASLGLSQFEKIEKIILIRQQKANYYHENLSNIPEVSLIIPPENFFSVYQMYTILLKNKEIRDKLKKFLEEKSISTRIYFEPIHLTNFYKEKYGFRNGDLPVTESLSERVLSLPIYPDLTQQQQDKIIKEIKLFFENEQSKQ